MLSTYKVKRNDSLAHFSIKRQFVSDPSILTPKNNSIPTNFAKKYTCNQIMIRSQVLTQVAESEAKFSTRHTVHVAQKFEVSGINTYSAAAEERCTVETTLMKVLAIRFRSCVPV